MRLLLILAGFAVVLTSCSQSEKPGSAAGQDQIRPGKTNQKYNLEYRFHTMEVTPGNRTVHGVSIRDLKNGDEVRFEPLESSFLVGESFVKNVSWSPDEEYLILPLGQFEGFCIIKSSEALKSVREKECFDTIRIQLKTGLQMSHQFASWDNSCAFMFTAGMERSFPQFRYDFSSRQLSALEKENDIFEGYNSNGAIPVVR